jgi:lipoyl(octanoyl) transferase
MTARRTLRGVWLGTRPYQAIFDLQTELATARAEGRVEDTVLFLEHPNVVTLGRGADPSHVLFGEAALRARGVDVVPSNRGGDVTVHAPGQLVGYPILELSPERRDVRKYVQDLTETMRRLASRHGIASGPVPGLIGLWVNKGAPAQFSPENGHDLAKLGAIGVRISRWVTMHGFALNLTTDPELFQLIVPCGIKEHGVTSVFELTGIAAPVREEADAAMEILGATLDRDVSAVEDRSALSPDALREALLKSP